MFSTEKDTGDVLSLTNAQDRLDLLFSSFDLFPSAVVLLDMGGVIEYANPVFIALGGYANKNEVVGKKYSDCTDDAGAIRLAGDITPALLSGSIWTGEFYQKKANGALYVSYMMCSLIGGRTGDRKHLLFNFYDVTEKRKNEGALKISDELLNLVLKNADIGTWELDISRNKWTFSKPFLDFLGYSQQEVGDDVSFWERLIHPDDLSRVSGALMNHLQAKNPVFECEYRVRAKSGEWKWVTTRGKVMGWSSGGKPSRVLGIYNSIHEARKNSESLKDIENKYRLVTENASEGVWIINDKDYTTYVNSAMGDILGCGANEMLGKTLGSYVSKNSAQAASSHISNIKQGIREHQELELLGKDGKRVYAAFETAPLLDEHGTYIGALAVVSDETWRKGTEEGITKSEERCRTAEKKYDFLASSIQEIACIADTKGIISFVTPGVARILGLEEKDVTGTRLHEYIHPADLQAFSQGYDKAVTGMRESWEFRLINKKGPMHYMKATCRIIERAEGDKEVLCILEDVTEYKKAEESLRQYAEKLTQSEERFEKLSGSIKEASRTEKRYRQLKEVALEGIWVVDETSNTSYVNYRMAEMLGYSVEEMLGRHIYMFMDEKAIEACKQGIEHSKQGITESHDFEYRRKDGLKVYSKTQTSPLTDDNGNYTGTLIAVLDRTAARTAEEKLSQSEEKYLKLLENIEDLFFSFNSKGEITYTGCAVARILGYEPRDLAGKKLKEYVHPEDIKLFEGIFTESLRGALAPYDFRLVDKGGSIHYMRGVSQAYVTSDGKRTLSMLLTDITDKKNAEELLRITEKRFQDVLETEEECVWETDAQFYYTFVSDRSVEIKGYTPKELTGRTIFEHMPEEDMERFRKEVEESITQKKPFRIELRTKNKKGEDSWEEINGKPLYGLEGKFMGLRGSSLSVTERKKAEKELKEAKVRSEEYLKDAKSKTEEEIRKAEKEIQAAKNRSEEEIRIAKNQAEKEIQAAKNRADQTVKEVERDSSRRIMETEQKSSEKMKETEEKAARIVKEIEHIEAEIIEFLPDATFVTDTQGKVISWNRAMEDLTGIASNDMIGKGASDYAQVLSRNCKPVRIDLSGRSKEELEGFGYNSVEIRDGSLYAKAFVDSPKGRSSYIWVKASPLLDSRGRKTGWITSIRDATDKKRVVDSLKDLHMRQKALLDNISDMAWLKDESLRYIAVNEAFEKACGRKEEEITGKTDQEIWSAELAEKYSRDDALVIQTGKGRCVEEAFTDGSSTRRWIETIKSPIFDGSDRVVGIAGIAKDVTDRKLVEDALRSTNEKPPERPLEGADLKRTGGRFHSFFKRS